MNDKQKKVMELRDFLESIDGVNGIRIYGYIPLAEILVEEGFCREKETARKIYNLMIGEFESFIPTEIAKEIAKRFGVEVE